jgi:hypothetical protein
MKGWYDTARTRLPSASRSFTISRPVLPRAPSTATGASSPTPAAAGASLDVCVCVCVCVCVQVSRTRSDAAIDRLSLSTVCHSIA